MQINAYWALLIGFNIGILVDRIVTAALRKPNHQELNAFLDTMRSIQTTDPDFFCCPDCNEPRAYHPNNKCIRTFK